MDKIEELLGLQMQIAVLHHRCAQALLEAHGIRRGQPPLLMAMLRLGACSQIELARALQITPASIAVSLKRLERSGLVQRVQDPGDLRMNRVELTYDGKRAARHAEDATSYIVRQMVQGLSLEEYQQLIRTMQKIRENLKELSEQIQETEESD